jgi:hypothetical protein
VLTRTVLTFAAACTLVVCAGAPVGAAGTRAHAVASRGAPSVRSMSLSVVNQGEVTYAVIDGARFAADPKVSLGPGVKCHVVSATSTRIAVRLTVATTATYGTRALTVTNPDRGAATLHGALHIEYEAILAKWAIGQGAVGFTTSLVRPDFVSPPSVSISGTGISVASASIGAGYTLELGFTVEQHAAATWRTMTLTQGLSTWQVENGVRIRHAPAVTSMTPLGQDTTDQGVKILGTNFEACTKVQPTVSISGTGVTVDSTSAALGTVMYAKLTVSPTAPIGPRDVTVTNCDSEGTATSANAFAVLAPPEVTSVDPLALGVTREELITGTNFTPTTAFSVPGGGVTIDHVDYLSMTRERATINVSPTATVGPNDVAARDGGGTPTLATGVFTVDPLPTEASVSPAGIGAGTTATLTVYGTGFRRKAVVTLGEPMLADPSLAQRGTTWVSPTELQVTVTAAQATGLGSDVVSVANDDGGAVATLGFTTDPAPVLAVDSSTTRPGSVVATYTAPTGAPKGETYELRLCASATLTTDCTTRAGFASGGAVTGLASGTAYWAQLTAPAASGFYTSTSEIVGPRRATSQLVAPKLLAVSPSASRAGAIAVRFARSPLDPELQAYVVTACRNRSMTMGCVTDRSATTRSQLTGLIEGATYHVRVLAVASSGYLAATSKESGAVHATIQLGAPTITRARRDGGALAVTFRPSKGASTAQRYTLWTCVNAAMTKGCSEHARYRSGEGLAGLGRLPRFARVVAAASNGRLGAASRVVRA